MSEISLTSTVVTSISTGATEDAHDLAKEFFDTLVSEIVYSPCNGVASFLIATSGSKYGWGEQLEFDIALDEFESIQMDENKCVHVLRFN